MALEVTMSLRNAQSLAAWEAEAQAQAKSEKQLAKNVGQYKVLETSQKAFAKQTQVIKDAESQLQQARAQGAAADIARYEKQLAAAQAVHDKMARSAQLASKKMQAAFEQGRIGHTLNAYNPSSDPFAAGLARMAAENKAQLEAAQAAGKAFAEGKGGLAYKPERNSWAEGIQNIAADNAAKATEAQKKLKKAIDETAAANKRLSDEVKQLSTTPLEKYAARFTELKNALRSGVIDQKGFNSAAKAAREEFESTAKAGNLAFGDQARDQIQSYLTGVFSIAGGLAVARKGWELIVKAQDDYLTKSKEMRDFNISLASSQANAILNLTGLSSERKAQVIEKDVPALQKTVGFGDQKELLKAVSSGYAAGGDIDKALSATAAAAKINRNTPENLAVQSGAALDIMRHTGEKDPETALSFLLQANPRATDPVKMAQNLPPVLGMARNAVKGDDDKEAARAGAAIFTVLTREGTDYYGEQGGTASAKLLEFQREWFDKHKKYIPKEGDSVNKRMEVLSSNPRLKKAFLASLSKKGAVEYRPAIENIMTPGTTANEEYKAEFARLQFDKQPYKDIEREMGSTSALKLGNIEAGSEATRQGFMADKEGQIRGLQAEAKKIGDSAVADTSKSGDWFHRYIDLNLNQTMYRMGGNREEVVQKRTLEGELERRKAALQSSEFWGDAKQAKTDRRDIALLEKQLAALEEITRGIKALQESNGRMADEPRTVPVRPPPAANGSGRD